MKVLALESSCDETAVGIYCEERGLLAHQIYSQIALHAPYGGVVPELASRDHIRKALPLINAALTEAKLTPQELTGLAYTKGPGLVGALMVGATLIHSLGWAWQLPVVGVHHLEAHLLAVMLEPEPPPFPWLALLVSGGHTQLIAVHKIGQYELLGESVDDAVGEAFDKTAKLLGLPYPGGPALAKLAASGVSGRFIFPRPMVGHAGLDFSFSGLKTYALNCFHQAEDTPQTRADIACAFQEAVVDTLWLKTRRAIKQTDIKNVVVVGGVSANESLRKRFSQELQALQSKAYFARLEFCTDNGAMIAYCGYQRLKAGEREGLAITVKPRWPITELVGLTLQD